MDAHTLPTTAARGTLALGDRGGGGVKYVMRFCDHARLTADAARLRRTLAAGDLLRRDDPRAERLRAEHRAVLDALEGKEMIVLEVRAEK